jgi:hypothetical protein
LELPGLRPIEPGSLLAACVESRRNSVGGRQLNADPLGGVKMSTRLAAFATVFLMFLVTACASFKSAPSNHQPFAIQIDYPAVAVPTVEPEAGVVVEPMIPLGNINTEPPLGWFCGGVVSEPAPRPYGTRWIVRSVSQVSEAPRTEAERYFADWFSHAEEPTIIFHLEGADR